MLRVIVDAGSPVRQSDGSTRYPLSPGIRRNHVPRCGGRHPTEMAVDLVGPIVDAVGTDLVQHEARCIGSLFDQ